MPSPPCVQHVGTIAVESVRNSRPPNDSLRPSMPSRPVASRLRRPAVPEPRLDRVEASADLVELGGQHVGRIALDTTTRGFDERRGNRGGDHGQEADPDDHHERSHETSSLAGLNEVSVAHGRDGLDGPPQSGPDVREVVGSVSRISSPPMIVTDTVTVAMIPAARYAVRRLRARSFAARAWARGGSAALR
jgi:hypothetical protein